jgi:hypothetical protein
MKLTIAHLTRIEIISGISPIFILHITIIQNIFTTQCEKIFDLLRTGLNVLPQIWRFFYYIITCLNHLEILQYLLHQSDNRHQYVAISQK